MINWTDNPRTPWFGVVEPEVTNVNYYSNFCLYFAMHYLLGSTGKQTFSAVTIKLFRYGKPQDAARVVFSI